MEDGIVLRRIETRSELDPGCTVAEVGGLKILFNFGTDYDLGIGHYKDLALLEGITHVLLCSADISSIGGLLYMQQLGICVPIVGTVPIKILGKIEVLERLQAMKVLEKKNLPEVNTEEAFDRIVPLKYMQVHALSDEVSVTPLNSGHSLGGAIWKIQKKDQEWVITDKVSHRREAHLDGLDVQSIASATGIAVNAVSLMQAKVTRKERDAKLVAVITETVKRGGTVFMPLSFSQLLEVVTTLRSRDETRSIGLALFSFYGKKYFDCAKTILEWAGTAILQRFNREKENPFSVHKLSFHTECFSDSFDAPIVLTVDKTGVSGFSNILLPLIGTSPQNTVVSVTGSLARTFTHPDIKYVRLSDKEMQRKKKEISEEEKKKETEKKIVTLLEQKLEEEEEQNKEEVLHKFWYEVENTVESDEKNQSYIHYDLMPSLKPLLFPVPEKKNLPDAYGESYPIKKEKAEEAEVLEEKEKEKEGLKYKLVINGLKETQILAEVHHIHFSGISDAHSLKLVLAGIPARSIVVYGDNPDHREVFAQYLRLSSESEIVSLEDEARITAKAETHQVKIEAKDLQHIEMVRLGNSLIGYFEGEFCRREGNRAPVLSIPEKKSPQTPLSLGDTRLSALREAFLDARLKAEIIDGSLVVGEHIIIQLLENTLKISGDLSRDFFTVKRILSERIAVIR